MIEITGWLNISISFDGEENSIELEKIIQEISNLIKPKIIFNQIFELKVINGSCILFIAINHNKDNGSYDMVYDLANKISKLARGTFGIIHVRKYYSNDESNKFKVIRIAKGVLDVYDDNLLSPCVPTIED